MSSGPLEVWLAQRDPAPPVQLAASLRAQVEQQAAAAPDMAPEAIADALVRASAASLRRLLAEGGTQRDSALELLAADALATYAFEAAADEPALLEARCRAAMRRFSEVVDGA